MWKTEELAPITSGRLDLRLLHTHQTIAKLKINLRTRSEFLA